MPPSFIRSGHHLDSSNRKTKSNSAQITGSRFRRGNGGTHQSVFPSVSPQACRVELREVHLLRRGSDTRITTRRITPRNTCFLFSISRTLLRLSKRPSRPCDEPKTLAVARRTAYGSFSDHLSRWFLQSRRKRSWRSAPRALQIIPLQSTPRAAPVPRNQTCDCGSNRGPCKKHTRREN